MHAQTNSYEESSDFRAALIALDNEDYNARKEYLAQEVAAHPNNGYAYMYLSIVFFELHDYDTALEKIEEALSLIPKKDNTTRAHSLAIRSSIQNRRGMTDEALKDLDEALRLCPKSIDILLKRADFYYRIGKYDESDSDYRKILAIESDNATAKIGIGRNKNGREDYQDAINYFTRILEHLSTNSDIPALRAQAYFALGYYQKSTIDVINAISLDGNENALQLLPLIAHQCLDFTVSKLEKEQQISPQDYVWPFCIGVVHESVKNYPRALSAYKEAYDLSKSASLSERLSDCYFAIGDYINAMQYINKAIELDAENTRYYASKANIYLQKKDFNGALLQMNLAIEKDASVSFNYFLRALIKELNEDPNGALEDYNECILRNSEFTEAYLNRGRIYMKRRDYDLARKDFENCVKQDTVPAMNNIANYALAYLGRKEEAICFTQKALEKSFSADNLYEAACIYSLVNEKDTSLEFLYKAINAGYCDYERIFTDPDLDIIRSEDSFKKTLETYITKAGYVDQNGDLRRVSKDLEFDFKETEDSQKQTESTNSNTEKEYCFTYTSFNGIYKVSSRINGLPYTINFINSNVGLRVSVYGADNLLKNRIINSSDIIMRDDYADGIPVGSTIIIRKLVIGDITLTNIRAKVVSNDNVPFSFGIKLLSGYTNISVQNGTVKMNKK